MPAAGRGVPNVWFMTLDQPGHRQRTRDLRVLRSRFLYWCLFFVPAVLTVLVWNYGYPQYAGVTGMGAVIGLVWFVRVWGETEQR